MTLPNHAYYKANHGRWRAELHFAITDRDAFRRASIGWLDRLRVRLMDLFGTFVLETSVEYREDGNVRHTTRISKFWMPLYVAEEIFMLDPNGSAVAIERWHRMWPALFGTREVGRSHGKVDASGLRASYEFPMLGTTMRQTGVIENDGVRMIQETGWSRSEQLLKRV